MSWFLIGAVGIFWAMVWLRVEQGRRKQAWRLGPDAARHPNLPRLAVVIPARDEARNIAACVASVKASDHRDIDLVVFDDGSTDGTAELAAGARVIRGEGELPVGWKGKPWALQRAMERVDAEWTLFLDADVRLHPAALSRALSYALDNELDLLSGLGKLEMGSFWEKVIQPSVGGLIIAGNNLDVVNDPEKPEKVIANGQFILVNTETWRRFGGHALVKDDILDDIGLARGFSSRGAKVRCLFMRELFSCRMYTGFSELWHGWTKNLFAGMHYKISTVIVLIGFICLYFLVPWVGLAFDSGHRAGWAAVIVLGQIVRLRMDRIFGQDPKYGLLQSLGAACLIGLLIDSVRRSRAGTIRWKGRTYSAG